MPSQAPLVAICMAAFDPDPELLERQIASIREQTHEAWVCLISDDGSSPERFELLAALTAEDARFELRRSDTRLGFYLNFERALTMVPPGGGLRRARRPGRPLVPAEARRAAGRARRRRLVYSDMRIVDPEGNLISETFWRGRRNNHTDLASLLLANTVTGAASLFPRKLLELALPFPRPVGDPFHDQWIACLALAAGDVAYVDRPLYDYVQHGGAARGHEAAMRPLERRPPAQLAPAAGELAGDRRALAALLRGQRAPHRAHREDDRSAPGDGDGGGQGGCRAPRRAPRGAGRGADGLARAALPAALHRAQRNDGDRALAVRGYLVAPSGRDAGAIRPPRAPPVVASPAMPTVLHVLPHPGGGGETYIDLLEGLDGYSPPAPRLQPDPFASPRRRVG